jgi:hypothetical protein
MSLETACAYLELGEKTFLALTRKHGVRPLYTDFRIRRWRRRDLDELVDSLPPQSFAPESVVETDASRPDPAEEGLRRITALSRPPRRAR